MELRIWVKDNIYHIEKLRIAKIDDSFQEFVPLKSTRI